MRNFFFLLPALLIVHHCQNSTSYASDVFKKIGNFTELYEGEGTLRNGVTFESQNQDSLIREICFNVRRNGDQECFCYTRKYFPFKHAKKDLESYLVYCKDILPFLQELKELDFINGKTYNEIISEITKSIDEEVLKKYNEKITQEKKEKIKKEIETDNFIK